MDTARGADGNLVFRRLAKTALAARAVRNDDPFPEYTLHAPAIVVAPHQDDECLGCGGMIRKRTALGGTVRVVFLTDGSGSHSTPGLVETRRAEARAALELLGVRGEGVHFLGHPDGALRTRAEAASSELVALLCEHSPAEIFVTARDEPHDDHAIAGEIVADAARVAPGTFVINEYPIWRWYDWPWVRFPFRSDLGSRRRALRLLGTNLKRGGSINLLREFHHVLDVASVVGTKRTALAAYQSQLEPEGGGASLRDVAHGDFLERFFTGSERFRRSIVS